jgi:hypothetical protein
MPGAFDFLTQESQQPNDPELRNASPWARMIMGLNAIGGKVGYPDIAQRTGQVADVGMGTLPFLVGGGSAASSVTRGTPEFDAAAARMLERKYPGEASATRADLLDKPSLAKITAQAHGDPNWPSRYWPRRLPQTADQAMGTDYVPSAAHRTQMNDDTGAWFGQNVLNDEQRQNMNEWLAKRSRGAFSLVGGK